MMSNRVGMNKLERIFVDVILQTELFIIRVMLQMHWCKTEQSTVKRFSSLEKYARASLEVSLCKIPSYVLISIFFFARNDDREL